jgi:hypothetical protein
VTQRGASLALGFGIQRFQRKEDEIALILGLVPVHHSNIPLFQYLFFNQKTG